MNKQQDSDFEDFESIKMVESTTKMFKHIARFSRIIGVLGFIGFIMLLTLSLDLLSNYFHSLHISSEDEFYIGSVFLVISIILFFGAITIFMFGYNMQIALNSNSNILFTKALKNLRLHLLIVVIVAFLCVSLFGFLYAIGGFQ